MTSVSSLCSNQYLPILETGDPTQIDALLAQTATMSESDINFLMFYASFPTISKTVFKTVVSAVLSWGDQFRKDQKARWLKLRRNQKKFAREIEWVIMDNYILDLMDARLTEKEANQLVGDRTPLHHAVFHKHCYTNPHFPELAVLKFLTSEYALDSTKQCDELHETAWHRACLKADLPVFRILAAETVYDSLHIADKFGDTPLHKLCGVSPCQPHSQEIGRFLLAHGIDRNALANDGKTAAGILSESLAKTPSRHGDALLSVLSNGMGFQGGAHHG
jgi:hypothetical protein